MNLVSLLKGASKALLLSLPTLFVTSEAAEAGTWRHCAGEDRQCTVPTDGYLGGDLVVGFSNGRVQARFGTGSSYTRGRSLPTTFHCHRETFNEDPLWGSRKHCQVRVYSFVHCAWEGEYCNLNGQAFTVRYGTSESDSRYFIQSAQQNGFFCGNGTFDRDPVRGQRKRCWVYQP